MKDASPQTGLYGLVLEQVSHAYDGKLVVDSVDISVAPGEFLCLLGPSGCGKTTTLRIAAGLEQPWKGRVFLGGKLVAGPGLHLPPEERQIGFLFQDFALFPHLSVLDNVAFGVPDRDPAARHRRAMDKLEQVGMADLARAFPHTLSGGQQQRVALARALAPRPRLMLLDEPFSGLDSRLRDQIRDETLHVIKAAGVTTVMVTHDPEEAMFMADRIALMRDGRIVQLGAPDTLYRHPSHPFVASFFGEVNRIAATVRNGEIVTSVGRFSAPDGSGEGSPVDVLIRPEGLHLEPRGEVEPLHAGEVLASRFLGRTSLIDLRVTNPGGNLDLRARVSGRFLPMTGDVLAITLDPAQVYVFPSESTR
jgi:iron(III) transport system ATP-binding protein